MPEKWETELRRLRKVEHPAGLQDRMREGPHHEAGRPTRERVAAAVVAFAVCGALLIVGFQTLDDDAATTPSVGGGVPAGETTVILELASNADGPTATLRYGDREQRAIFEGATWCPEGATGDSECSSYIADFAFYPPVNDFLVVPPGTPVEVMGEGAIDAVNVSDPSGEAVAVVEVFDVPDADGLYVFDIDASWPQGDGSFFVGIQTLSDPSAAPDVLTVDCTSFVARLDTAVVRTQADGLHLRIVGDVDGFAIGVPGPDGTGEPTAAIGGTEQGVVPLDPGRWGIKCGTESAIGSLLTSFELIDPDDHHAPEQLACGAEAEATFGSSIPVATSHAEVAAQLFAGLQPTDRIRGAGYGAETWHLGFTYVVDRGGEAVARLVLGEDGEVWIGAFSTCEGSGIELTDAATVGASPPTAVSADTLFVRCEGLGPAIEAEKVHLQSDGLHVEASNIADAAFVRIEGADGPVYGGSVEFTEVTERFVVDLEPGMYWVGCEVAQRIDGIGHVEIPDAYMTFEVIAAE